MTRARRGRCGGSYRAEDPVNMLYLLIVVLLILAVLAVLGVL